jgi:hypothetical protein
VRGFKHGGRGGHCSLRSEEEEAEEENEEEAAVGEEEDAGSSDESMLGALVEIGGDDTGGSTGHGADRGGSFSGGEGMGCDAAAPGTAVDEEEEPFAAGLRHGLFDIQALASLY